jgi:hypothetical protein
MWSWLTVQTAGLGPMVASYSYAVIAVLACLAFAYFSPINKTWGLWGAAIVVAATLFYAKGVSDGQRHVQAKWDAAERAATVKGANARGAAERDVSRLPAGRLRNDHYDRDNH